MNQVIKTIEKQCLPFFFNQLMPGELLVSSPQSTSQKLTSMVGVLVASFCSISKFEGFEVEQAVQILQKKT
jgi:hypothetical protein